MSKKANPTVVGVFVLAAIILTLATVITLGKIKLKDDRIRCVAFFTGSLYGLDIGAPVTFRGVTIGRVGAVRIHFDVNENQYIIPVYIDIEQNPAQSNGQALDRQPEKIRDMLQQLINQGLRAQLKISSLLTSKLYIDLALYPDSAMQLHGKQKALLEIPTLPSGLEQITQKLESLPLSEILHKTSTALDGINNLLNSQETRRALRSLETTLGHIDTELPGMIKELKQGLANFAALSATADNLLKTADKELPPMSRELQRLLSGVTTTAQALTKTLNNMERMTAKDSDFSFQLASSLQELEKTAASIRQLTEYLQQHPNALIFGQGGEKP